MGCNCKAKSSISLLNKNYGNGDDKEKDNLSTVLLRCLIFVLLIPVYVILLPTVMLIGMFNKKVIDINGLLKFKNV